MACNAPVSGWYSRKRNPNGKRSIVFRFQDGYSDRPVTVPCGRCLGCKQTRAREWGIRCYHEASMWKENVFVTLTYKEDALPLTPVGIPTLRPKDFVLFMKAVRRARGPGVRFFHCGEYGNGGRPHHHVILFNCGFRDRIPTSRCSSGVIYGSLELERLWPFGFSSFGDVSFASASYVARYALKKIGVKDVEGRKAEYLTMSRRPGIGASWYEKFKSGVFPRDEVVIGLGKTYQAPRFYVERFRKESVLGYEMLKVERAWKSLVSEKERNSAERMYANEVCLRARMDETTKREL